jgi:hypothetical protein
MLSELGGVQPYVVWVGVGLLVLKVAMVITIFKEGAPGESGHERPEVKPAAVMSV